MGVEAQRILGVDTSLRSSGVGVIEVRGSQMRAVAYGRIYNRPAELHSRCLLHIFEEVSELIEAHKPDFVAIEGAFFAKNAKTAMVAPVRGSICATPRIRVPWSQRSSSSSTHTPTARRTQTKLLRATGMCLSLTSCSKPLSSTRNHWGRSTDEGALAK